MTLVRVVDVDGVERLVNHTLEASRRRAATNAAKTCGARTVWLDAAAPLLASDRMVLFNLGASYQLTEQLVVDLQLKNLTDRYHEYVWYDGAQTLHAPGDGRALYAAVTLDF